MIKLTGPEPRRRRRKFVEENFTFNFCCLLFVDDEKSEIRKTLAIAVEKGNKFNECLKSIYRSTFFSSSTPAAQRGRLFDFLASFQRRKFWFPLLVVTVAPLLLHAWRVGEALAASRLMTLVGCFEEILLPLERREGSGARGKFEYSQIFMGGGGGMSSDGPVHQDIAVSILWGN